MKFVYSNLLQIRIRVSIVFIIREKYKNFHENSNCYYFTN